MVGLLACLCHAETREETLRLREYFAKLEIDCTILHLRENFGIYKSFTNTTNVEMEDCEDTIYSLQNMHNREIRSLIDGEDLSEDVSECMMEHLKTFNTADFSMMHSLYSEDKSMTPLERMMAKVNAGTHISVKFEVASDLCLPDKNFGELFEETFELEETAPEYNETTDDLGELQLDYCMRKHIVDKNLIDSRVHKVNLNPKGVNVAGVDCDKLYNEYFEEFSISLKDKFVTAMSPTTKQTRCMMNTIKKEDYVGKSLKVWALGELKISADQEKIEKHNYIDFMKDLYTKILECIDSPNK